MFDNDNCNDSQMRQIPRRDSYADIKPRIGMYITDCETWTGLYIYVSL